jgi:hypothetical protein
MARRESAERSKDGDAGARIKHGRFLSGNCFHPYSYCLAIKVIKGLYLNSRFPHSKNDRCGRVCLARTSTELLNGPQITHAHTPACAPAECLRETAHRTRLSGTFQFFHFLRREFVATEMAH